jgi:hypothetical protein
MESVEPRPRESTDENSPHYAYQPAKMKMDRVLRKYYFCSTSLRNKVSSPIKSPDRTEGDSRKEKGQLFGCPFARCLGNATKSAEHSMDAMPNSHGGIASAARQL